MTKDKPTGRPEADGAQRDCAKRGKVNGRSWATRLRGAAGALLLLTAGTQAEAALTMADVTTWAGIPEAPGVNHAVLVIDWADTQGSLLWGYRWAAGQSRTGIDLLAAVIGADPRLTASGLAANFITNIGWDADLNGSKDRFHPGYDAGTQAYWNFFVNNEVYYHPTDFSQNGHIVPPALVVEPLGSPFDGAGPGRWVESSTGPLDRPLVDGSWDGYIWQPYGAGAPGLPVPEPGSVGLCLLGAGGWLLRRRRGAAAGLLGLTTAAQVVAGPFAPAAGLPGSTAINAHDSRFRGWATGAGPFLRGVEDISEPGSAFVTYGNPFDAAGPSDAPGDGEERDFQPVVSLGDGGEMVLSFGTPISDGPGPDLAVFENAFSDSFLELAHVEVSSDGEHFYRFPSVCLTPTTRQLGSGGLSDTTNIHNLAGKYRSGWGTPFDLSELAGAPLLDLKAVRYVKLIDVVGSINPAYGTMDSQGHLINEPWPTPFFSAGFDLDATGVLHDRLETWEGWAAEQFQPADFNTGPQDDADGDGRSNLLEFAFATDPHVPQEPLTAGRVVRNGGEVSVSLPRRPAAWELDFQVESSPDLGEWHALAVSHRGEPAVALPPAVLAETPRPDGLVDMTVTVPEGTGGFFRLAVAVR